MSFYVTKAQKHRGKDKENLLKAIVQSINKLVELKKRLHLICRFLISKCHTKQSLLTRTAAASSAYPMLINNRV